LQTGQCLCDVRARCGMISFVSIIYRDTRLAARGWADGICDPIFIHIW
jgi:hypothetical protein